MVSFTYSKQVTSRNHLTAKSANNCSFPLGDVILTGLPRPEHVSAAMGLEGESINPNGTLTAFTWRP